MSVSDNPEASPVMEGAEPTYSSGGKAGILLLHDLAGSPQIFSTLSEVLSKQDFAVDVPLLPGHGTNLKELTKTTWDDWAAAAQLALDELASRSGNVIVCGIGMGATLGCYVGAQHPAVRGVVAINPRAVPVPEEAISMLRAMMADGCELLPPLRPDISDHAVPVVEYKTVPVETLINMFKAVQDMADHWNELTCPLLIVVSERDHRVSPFNAEWLAARSGGIVEQASLPNSFHLAPLDVDHAELEALITKFALQFL